ncbi:MAG: hypothetical protein AABY76_05570, partial [Planctomycetota bacterium]
ITYQFPIWNIYLWPSPLSERARELFSLKETVILYDLTNTYFEGSKRGSKIARHGVSKEAKEKAILLQKEQRFERELSSIKEGLASVRIVIY